MSSATKRVVASDILPHGQCPKRLAVYADGASVSEMLAAYEAGTVAGFTTNPTLMAKAGITDYRAFGREVLSAIRDLPVSFEVLADDVPTMRDQARELASWGDNVYVKIPIVNTSGESMVPLIHELAWERIKVNITAVMTLDQVHSIVTAIPADVPAVCSIFAGRIADTGRDPVPLMREAVQVCAAKPQISVLWASPREVLNVYQAEACGCHIITMTRDLLAKLSLRNKDLTEFSRETAQMFFNDARRAGLIL